MKETAEMPRAPLSLHRDAGDFVFLSGQLAFDDKGTITGATVAEQTQNIFNRIRTVLASTGLALKDVVKTTIWLTDAQDFQQFNMAYAEEFTGLDLPARSTVVTQLVVPGAKVEIKAVAKRPER